jgi:hypothetical protein
MAVFMSSVMRALRLILLLFRKYRREKRQSRQLLRAGGSFLLRNGLD